jgi:hypothetical protein
VSRENTVPISRLIELPRSSNQESFPKGKVQEHTERKTHPQMLTSAIECHQALSNAQAPHSGKIFQHVTLSASMEASTMKHQVGAKFCLALTKHPDHSWRYGRCSQVPVFPMFPYGIVLESVDFF